MRSRIEAVIIVVSLLVYGGTASATTLLERLAQLLGLDKTTAGRLSVPRGSSEASSVGSQVVVLDCSNATESVLWRCGKCKSPVPDGDGHVVVLRDDGVWRIERPQEAKRISEATDVQALLGPPGGQQGVVWALRKLAEEPLQTLWALNAKTGAMTRLPLQPASRQEVDVLRAVQPASLKGEGMLRAKERSARSCGEREVLLEPHARVGLSPVCGSVEIKGLGYLDRFDPVWRGHQAVYLATEIAKP